MPEANASSTILIIEDSEIGRSILGGIFAEAGFTDVQYAKDGREGLEKTLRIFPDLVILDLIMPRMDGFDYLRHIRSIQEFNNLPIIVQTSISDSRKHSEAFAAGATDLIIKPVTPSELIARATVHLENQSLVRNLQQYRKRVEHELHQAREMQYALLPDRPVIDEIEVQQRLRISSYFAPSEELSGDLWGIHPVNDHTFAIYQVDFTGHGVMAALNTFRLHTLIETKLKPHTDPGGYLSELNLHLHELLSAGVFATMFYGVINTAESRLDYASAATTNPLLLTHQNTIEILDGSGLPLSVKAHAEYETKSISFQPGDTLVLYSDALIEKQRIDKEAFDEARLIETCREVMPVVDPEALMLYVITRFNLITGDDRLDDDLTMAIVHRLP